MTDPNLARDPALADRTRTRAPEPEVVWAIDPNSLLADLNQTTANPATAAPATTAPAKAPAEAPAAEHDTPSVEEPAERWRPLAEIHTGTEDAEETWEPYAGRGATPPKAPRTRRRLLGPIKVKWVLLVLVNAFFFIFPTQQAIPLLSALVAGMAIYPLAGKMYAAQWRHFPWFMWPGVAIAKVIALIYGKTGRGLMLAAPWILPGLALGIIYHMLHHQLGLPYTPLGRQYGN